METRWFGRTGHLSTVAIFGAARERFAPMGEAEREALIATAGEHEPLFA